MWPFLFRSGGVTVYNYSLAALLAGVLFAVLGAWRFRRLGGDGAAGVDGAALFLLCMYPLSHVTYCFATFGFTEKAVHQLLDLGGAWGGQALLLTALFLYLRARRALLGEALDIFAPAVLLGFAVAKVGCLCAGCCWGGPSGSFPGIPLSRESLFAGCYPPGPLHPVPLYDVAWGLLSLGALLLLERRRPPAGTVFFVFLFLYGAGRFLTEFLRYPCEGDLYGETSKILGLFPSQWAEAAAAAFGLGACLFLRTRGKKKGSFPPRAKVLRDRLYGGGESLAGLRARAFAFLLDFGLTGAVICSVLVLRGGGVLLPFGSGFFSFVFLFVLLPRTPGQRLLAVAPRTRDGSLPGLLRRCVRAGGMLISLCTVVGLFRPLLSSSRQAIHDLVTGTYMIQA